MRIIITFTTLFLTVIALGACRTVSEDYSTDVFEEIHDRAAG